MQPRRLLILVVVVLALGAYVWFVDRDLPSSEERAELAKKVLPVELPDVLGLVLEWDENRVVLERSGSGGAIQIWRRRRGAPSWDAPGAAYGRVEGRLHQVERWRARD